jgi:prepilin-type N-terminal cleavage/methylation domain-containing protein
MMNRVWEDRKSEKGFTLTELLVVIAILGILAAVVVFAVGGIGSDSQTNACSTDKNTLQTAQEAYYAKNGSYAANGAALVTAKFLRQDSNWYTTNNTGSVTAVPAASGGKCT